MRRTLPPQANLDHLKKQAKDLLDGHKGADPSALARIRDALPAFADLGDAELAAAPFALHDAQSAIAREYGSKSWLDLRDAVASQSREPAAPSDALLRALMSMPFPPEVGDALREATTRRGAAAAAAEGPLGDRLPLVPVRDALFLPRAIAPVHIARPGTVAAVSASIARTPPTLAVFAQRTAARDNVDLTSLHPVGCEVFVHARVADGKTRAWIVLEGLRWIALEALDRHADGYDVARVSPVSIDRTGAEGAEAVTLTGELRARARDLASAFPEGARLVARIEAAEPERLADLVVANLPVSVEEKARYATERRLVERLRIASGLISRG